MNKHGKKMSVAIMEPVKLYRDSLISLLDDRLYDKFDIMGVTGSLSELVHLFVMKGAADIYVMEAYGHKEDYKNWGKFTHFLAANAPNSLCLLWSSKPTVFLRQFAYFTERQRCWQISKKVAVDVFVHLLTRLPDEGAVSHSHLCIGPSITSLTLSEIIVITGVVEGYSAEKLSRKYGAAYKTICSHKRNAMVKMRVSGTAQLRDFFMVKEVSDNEACSIPIEISHAHVP
ncbi:LuxR C-terminal-related transcriptional regulator [Serratia ureilytica]|uniref:helix-turn-helix transcriptional regulator n=1 Tax=Serratia ureilytica TaxID=300181 RepID=UPI002499DD22|nr:LuxR C-terminal-related transcriptional regulator [Serratia ureilytica]MDI3197814.1 LuxR C-terminal-related transcriptional regulator [Serratia ureilytica]